VNSPSVSKNCTKPCGTCLGSPEYLENGFLVMHLDGNGITTATDTWNAVGIYDNIVPGDAGWFGIRDSDGAAIVVAAPVVTIAASA
jgi:hypothetical protein